MSLLNTFDDLNKTIANKNGCFKNWQDRQAQNFAVHNVDYQLIIVVKNNHVLNEELLDEYVTKYEKKYDHYLNPTIVHENQYGEVWIYVKRYNTIIRNLFVPEDMTWISLNSFLNGRNSKLIKKLEENDELEIYRFPVKSEKINGMNHRYISYITYKSGFSEIAQTNCNLYSDFHTLHYFFPDFDELKDCKYKLHKKIKLQLLKYHLTCRKLQYIRANNPENYRGIAIVSYEVNKSRKKI